MNKKTAILLVISATQVLAADNAYSLDALSVTALREEETVFSQPLSIDVKQSDEIKLDQVIFQKDLFNSISGVRIEQTGSIIGHKTSIRMPLSTDPYYLFLQDGIAVQSSGFFNHNGLAYTTYGSANSVEILKGTGSALYGSDAMAGTINVLSATQPTKELKKTLHTNIGSDGYKSISTTLSDTIDQKKSYSLGVRYDHNDGWREHSKSERLETNGRFDYLINKDNAVKIVLAASKTDAQQADDFLNYSNIENGSEAASDDPKYYTALSNTDVRRQFDYARLSAEFTNYALEDAEVSITPYLRYNRNHYVATWETTLPTNDSVQQSVGLLNKIKYEPTWGRVIVGLDAEYTHADQQNNQEYDYNASILKGAIYDYTVDYYSLSPYIHTDYKVSSVLTLSGGIRYDYSHYAYDNKLSDGNVFNIYYRTSDRKDSFKHTSPKLSLSYQPSAELNLYARYANGFRIPQASMLYSLKKGYETYGLNPETSDMYEIGIKKGNQTNYAELSGYVTKIKDTFTQDQAAGVKYYRNGGMSVHRGIELGIFAQVTSEVVAKGSYSYSQHFYENDTTYHDNQMASAPHHMANGRLFYTPESINDLVIMGEWQYTGSYWMDDAHVKKYGGYSIGNLKADYAYAKALSIFAKITNITDERYATSATYAYSKSKYTPGDPRQFFAGLEYTW